MKQSVFLVKLAKEGKLELVEPSENIKKAYIKKSESYHQSSKILLDAQHYEESVSMAYYSMYHMLTALLFSIGIKCENHSAAIILLKLLFGQDNEQISFAKKERVDKQYYVDFKIKGGDVEQLITTAEHFNSHLLDFIERLNERDIQDNRKKCDEIMKGMC
ncbi:HEPN domain-containing protein [Candidatus Woesearchaeota archaeon]|nr:HEPN domain-containing protein [Candidatus Woesearchaeota archaeon]